MSISFVGASREAYASALERLEAAVEGRSADELSRVGDDLFAVAGVLHNEGALRRALADPALRKEAKAEVIDSLLGSRLSTTSVELVRDVVTARWSSPRDLVDGIDALGVQAVLAGAEKAGVLDDVEDELFRFGRIIDREGELVVALADPVAPVDSRLGLLRDVLADRVKPATRRLLEEVVAAPRGRTLGNAIDDFVRIAANRRSRLVAEVYSAVPLSGEQVERLAEALSRLYGRAIAVQAAVDPRVLGGLRIRVGDEILDATIASKLDLARRRLAG